MFHLIASCFLIPPHALHALLFQLPVMLLCTSLTAHGPTIVSHTADFDRIALSNPLHQLPLLPSLKPFFWLFFQC